MKICLIGQNLTNFILALVLAEKKLKIDIYLNNKIKNLKTYRTIAISNKNFQFLKNITHSSLSGWKVKDIKIFLENFKTKETINFNHNDKNVFNLVNYSELNKTLISKIKKNKFINFIYSKQNKYQILDKIKNYDLVIDTDKNNIVTKKKFTNYLKKDYKSYAYTFVINHKRIKNFTAIQIFTKFGPLAFLPISNSKTSIVFSCVGDKKKNEQILSLFKKYNIFFKNKTITKIEKFELKFYLLRNYTNDNIMAFGDLIHRIHPLAGQGFNMTIRDIKILSKIIDEKISLGLPIDISVAEEFENSVKHVNYFYSNMIDGIYEFFKMDSKLNNSISKPIFSILNNSKTFKKYSSILSDEGLNF